jgi:hypothetical protein
MVINMMQNFAEQRRLQKWSKNGAPTKGTLTWCCDHTLGRASNLQRNKYTVTNWGLQD